MSDSDKEDESGSDEKDVNVAEAQCMVVCS